MASKGKLKALTLAIVVVCAVSPWLGRQLAQGFGNSLLFMPAQAKDGHHEGGHPGGGDMGGGGGGSATAGAGANGAAGGASGNTAGGDGKAKGDSAKGDDFGDSSVQAQKLDGDKTGKLGKHHHHKKGKSDGDDGDTTSQTASTNAMTTPAVVVSETEVATIKAKMVAEAAVKPDNGGGSHNTGSPTNFANGEVLAVGLDADALAVANALGFGVQYATGDDEGVFRVTRLRVPAGIDTLTALRALRVALPGNKVALNSLYRIFQKSGGGASTPSVDLSPGTSCTGEQCKPRSVIGWKDALRRCSEGLSIGMIDTGLDTSHPALARSVSGNKIVTASFRQERNKPASSEHGTGVAALLVGDAANGVAGLVPDVTLYAADAFYAVDGQPVTDTVSLLRALDWMRRHKVTLVNMSFAGPDDPLLAAAIKQAIDEGMVVVAAAGNEGAGAPPAFPAAYPGVIAVTAVSNDLKPYQRANRGAYIALAAPGVRIWTASANGKATFASGTSFAAPYVTAIAATLMRSAGPTASSQDILRAIPVQSLGAEDWSPVFGHGLAKAPHDCNATQVAERLPWIARPSTAAGSNATPAAVTANVATTLGFTSASVAQ